MTANTDNKIKPKKWSLSKKFAVFASPFLILGALFAGYANYEHDNSHHQSDFFGSLADQSHHHVTTDLSSPNIMPPTGPFNKRLGYTSFDKIQSSLELQGCTLVSKATGETATWQGPDFVPAVKLFPIYDEKNQAGLSIVDRNNTALHQAAYPRIIYNDFDDIPELVVKSLLYVENREQLEPNIKDSRNYAIEWDRKFYAVMQQIYDKIGIGGDGSGGSTLAEQLEKLRHSEGGHTNGMLDKASQVFTASARAYSKSRESTLETRRQAVTNYINAVPLSGYSGYGEVIGMADGLAVWFGTDIDDFNAIMMKDERALSKEEWFKKGQYYRQTLALIMAVQRPTTFLRQDRDALDDRIDRYLPSFGRAGLISQKLKRIAWAQRLDWAQSIDPDLLPKDPEKFAHLVRVNLLQAAGLKSLHDFDRMDIAAESTIDKRATQIVNKALYDLGNPYTDIGRLVIGERMAKFDTAHNIQYSFTLYQNVGEANHLLVQTDNFGGEFNLNEDSMLELGSTAKLRTLITYLEYSLESYRSLSSLSREVLPILSERQGEEDGITQFVLEYLNDEERLEPPSEQGFLNAAMERIYSANNIKRFYTGGGLHQFQNFQVNDNWREVSVRQAFEDSINLPFIRMMEDVVHHIIHNRLDIDINVYDDVTHPLRQQYIDRYILHDAVQHFSLYYRQYKGLSGQEVADQIKQKLSDEGRPSHIAALYRYLYPDMGLAQFSVMVQSSTGDAYSDGLDEEELNRLYHDYAPEAITLHERAYVAGLHPIDMWLAAQLIDNTDTPFSDLRRGVVRMAPSVYDWLKESDNEFVKTRHVFTMLEQDAFIYLHKNWADKGFPFRRLIPSFASSIGVSGDTPKALANLMGVIENDGKRYKDVEFTNISLGKDTPYERNFICTTNDAEQVLDPQIAAIVKENLENIVQNGTARRAQNVFKDTAYEDKWHVGGKTGTGDNRIEYHDRFGNTTLSEVRNRTATFVFTFGDQYYGSIVAYAAGEHAQDEDFTSALPVQAFNEIIKRLVPVLEQQDNQPQTISYQEIALAKPSV